MSFISPVFLRVKYYCKFLSDFESPPFDRFHRSICRIYIYCGAPHVRKKKKIEKKRFVDFKQNEERKGSTSSQRVLNQQFNDVTGKHLNTPCFLSQDFFTVMQIL